MTGHLAAIFPAPKQFMECIHSHFAQSHNIGPLSSPAGSSDPPQNTVSESAMTLLNLMGSLRGMKTCCAHFLFGAITQPPTALF